MTFLTSPCPESVNFPSRGVRESTKVLTHGAPARALDVLGQRFTSNLPILLDKILFASYMCSVADNSIVGLKIPQGASSCGQDQHLNPDLQATEAHMEEQKPKKTKKMDGSWSLRT